MNDQAKSILFFNNMLTPKIITAIYWLCLLGSVVSGIGSMFGGYGGFSFSNFFMGLLIALGGAIGSRIMCELMIVLFKMHEALQVIQSK